MLGHELVVPREDLDGDAIGLSAASVSAHALARRVEERGEAGEPQVALVVDAVGGLMGHGPVRDGQDPVPVRRQAGGRAPRTPLARGRVEGDGAAALDGRADGQHALGRALRDQESLAAVLDAPPTSGAAESRRGSRRTAR